MRWKLQEYELGIFVFNVMGGGWRTTGSWLSPFTDPTTGSWHVCQLRSAYAPFCSALGLSA